MLEAKYLDHAIAQNLSSDDPDAWTCMRLAAQLYIRDRLYGQPVEPAPPKQPDQGYALADAPQTPAEEIVYYPGKSEFGKAIQGKPAAQIWPVIDDVMSILQTLSPKIYNAAMHKIKD